MDEKARILAVDDEPRGVELAVRTLRRFGTVQTATTGEQGWELAQAERFDLVISDERMPGMSGIELLTRIAEAQPEAGRVLLTGYADIEASIDAINRARVHAYVNKPCNPTMLRNTVEGVLDRVRLARSRAQLLIELEQKNEELADKNEELGEILASLRLAQQTLVEAERLSAIGATAGTIVHDLRGPLAVIGPAARALGEDASLSGDEQKSLATTMVEESERMQRMCTELLDATRFSAGRPKRVEDALDEVIEDAIAALAHEAGRAGVAIESDLASGAHFPIDADRLRRALLNLGRNAIEAMPDGGALRFRSKREGSHARVCVEDSGVGIPEEIRGRLFEPFATLGKAQGTGLGLAIVKKVVREHDGSIEVGKPEGGGTVFTLCFRIPGER